MIINNYTNTKYSYSGFPLIDSLNINYTLDQFPTASFTLHTLPSETASILEAFKEKRLPFFLNYFQVSAINISKQTTLGDEINRDILSFSCQYFIEDKLDIAYSVNIPVTGEGVTLNSEVPLRTDSIRPLKEILKTTIGAYRYFQAYSVDSITTTARSELDYILKTFCLQINQSLLPSKKVETINYGVAPNTHFIQSDQIYNTSSASLNLNKIDIPPTVVWKSTIDKLIKRLPITFTYKLNKLEGSIRDFLSQSDQIIMAMPTPLPIKCFEFGTYNTNSVLYDNANNFNSLNDNGGQTHNYSKKCYKNGVLLSDKVVIYGNVYTESGAFGNKFYGIVEDYTTTYQFIFYGKYFRENGSRTLGYKKQSIESPSLSRLGGQSNKTLQDLENNTIASQNPSIQQFYKSLFKVITIPIRKQTTNTYEKLQNYYKDLKKQKTPFPLEFMSKSVESEDSRQKLEIKDYKGNRTLPFDLGTYSVNNTNIEINHIASCNTRLTDTFSIEQNNFSITYIKGQAQRVSDTSYSIQEGRPPSVPYILSTN